MADMDKGMDELDLLLGQVQAKVQDREQDGHGHMPAGLEQRILADAGRVQAGFSGGGAQARAPVAAGLWAQILAGLGGWPVMGGLATACAAGVWIGLAPPAFLPDPAQLVLGGGAYIDLINMDDMAAALSAEEG